MADNIKDFAITWILAGLLMLSLLSFALTFAFNNNDKALGENQEQINILKNNFSNSLTEIEGDMDSKINSSAKLNSEDSSLGVAAASSTSYGFFGTSQSNWTILKLMIAWVFAGSFGQMIVKIISGIIGLVGLYYIIKLIRSLF